MEISEGGVQGRGAAVEQSKEEGCTCHHYSFHVSIIDVNLRIPV